ncbi:hypothetical protein [Streptomyces sp. NPDC002671]
MGTARGDGEAPNHHSGGAGAPHADAVPGVPDRTITLTRPAQGAASPRTDHHTIELKRPYAHSPAGDGSEKNVLDFSRTYGLLPVTVSASLAMSESDSAPDKTLQPFLDQLPTSELYPAGKTSWAAVSAAVKQDIGQAVTPGGSPSGVLARLQATATAADSSAATAG